MIGNRIKELREKKGKTQKELGEAIGVTTSMVGMYEIGDRNPSPKVLGNLANYFNVSTDYILGRIESQFVSEEPSIYKTLDNVTMQLRVNDSLTEEEKHLLLEETAEYLKFRMEKKKGEKK